MSLPYFQKKFKSNIPSALLTSLIFGLWVIPGYLISSLGTSTDFIFYVVQLMMFILFMSYVFNATKGNLLIYLFTFWLAATGSQIYFLVY
ncbi:MAG TPA: CPBP family glutamic-type intramembrane protease [Candidatus Dormibacteraeota bacterium]|nr:CPBP family glutamic-type intramembrane protease [Candidatus Dormibacteraeota bacterium]